MTNINCTADCIHQKEGKCCLDRVEPSYEMNSGCAYFKGLSDTKPVQSNNYYRKTQ